MTEHTDTPTDVPAPEAPVSQPDDSSTPPTLAVFVGDDELVCVDDTCAPVGGAK